MYKEAQELAQAFDQALSSAGCTDASGTFIARSYQTKISNELVSLKLSVLTPTRYTPLGYVLTIKAHRTPRAAWAAGSFVPLLFRIGKQKWDIGGGTIVRAKLESDVSRFITDSAKRQALDYIMTEVTCINQRKSGILILLFQRMSNSTIPDFGQLFKQLAVLLSD